MDKCLDSVMFQKYKLNKALDSFAILHGNVCGRGEILMELAIKYAQFGKFQFLRESGSFWSYEDCLDPYPPP